MQTKLREETIQHFSETYATRPLGMHGKELPKFADNLKEYWKATNPSKSSQSSFKKIELVEKINKPLQETPDPTQNKFSKNNEYSSSRTQASEVSITKDYMKNSRWTTYHYNFIGKTPTNTSKTREKSKNPHKPQAAKDSKQQKPLIVHRLIHKKTFSPIKDQLRSTGFS